MKYKIIQLPYNEGYRLMRSVFHFWWVDCYYSVYPSADCPDADYTKPWIYKTLDVAKDDLKRFKMEKAQEKADRKNHVPNKNKPIVILRDKD